MSKPEYSGSVYDLVSAQARRNPAAAAILSPGCRPLTCADLCEHCAVTARSLASHGIGSRDRVAIVLPNGPEMALAFLGVAACATAAPLNPAYGAKEFDFYLADLDAKALVTGPGMESAAVRAAERRGIPVMELSPAPGAGGGAFCLRGRGANSPSPAEVKISFRGPDDLALVLHTSGTTSRPKRVPLTHRNLCVSAENVAQALRLTERDRCLNVMPLFHIHGLVAGLLASLRAGASVVCAPGFIAPKFFDWMKEFHPTWYTAVPTMHQAILAQAPANRRTIAESPLRLIRSSSAALAPKLMADLEAAFGAPVVEAYGMTEAAHQIASNPLPPGARKAGSVGVAAGPEIAILGEGARPLQAGRTGEIVLRGANLTRGYEGNAEANEAAFADGWFRTGDQGYLDAEGYLHITGRIKEVINRGGEKVSPREVDEALLEHPAIAQAVTFAMPDSRLGEDVAAAVVLRADAAPSEGQIREFVAGRLAAFKVPRKVVVLKELPKGPTGKLQRIGLAARLGLTGTPEEAPGAQPEYVAPRTPVEQDLAQLWSKTLGADRVGVHDRFLALGGDSILAAQLTARIRDAYGVEFLLIWLFDEAATIAEMAERIRTAASRKGVAYRSRLGAGDLEEKGCPPPLSYAQQRMWFLSQWQPESPVYNQPSGFRLHGALDLDALYRALDAIVARHEPLRTTFRAAAGEPLPVTAPSCPMPRNIIDLSALPNNGREAELTRLLAKECRRPFDLSRDILLRALVVRLDREEHALLLVTHHIASDGTSAAVMRRELSALYAAFVRGAAPELADLPIQYADFARWQRSAGQEKELEGHLAYWRRHLEGAPLDLPLPADRPRPAIRTDGGDRVSLNLSGELARSLTTLSRKLDVTLFMTLLAAFEVLLNRHTGQEDLLLGTATANRNRTELEPLIGFFVNTVVMRADLSGDPAFRELLHRVRKTALEASAHQDMPFERLVKELQPGRDLSRTPLIQAFFILQNVPRAPLALPGVEVRAMDLGTGTAKFDLHLAMTETPEGITAQFEYSTDIFERATVARMADHFRVLLEGIAADPDRRISELPLLTEAERRQILVEWNRTAADYPADKCVHELFEEQAARDPSRVAVIHRGAHFTRGEINARANQFAHYLRGLSVGRDVPVAICLRRSQEMFVGILGILKAGGAYVPLDPEFPRDRLAYMLRDSGAAMLITQEELLPQFHDYRGRIIVLDRKPSVLAGQPEWNPEKVNRPEDLIYIMYTSGTTGRPKGIQIVHRGVVNFLHFQSKTYNLGEKDTVLLLPPVAWDGSVDDLFLPLMTGGKVVVPTDIEAMDPEALLRHIEERRVTALLSVVPAMLRALTAAVREHIERAKDCALDALEETAQRTAVSSGRSGDSLRLLIVVGEAWFVADYRAAQAVFGDSVLIANHYGPTECTCTQTFYPVRTPPAEEGILCIGRPTINHEVYILDAHRQPVPVGVPGEIYIAGVGLARGYVNLPELTAEKFVPHPFSALPGARLYRTGDLGRYRADGNVDFLGRMDHQVKLRGNRIELGEIVAVLRRHPAVREAVVVRREDSPGDPRLVAYVVPSDPPPTPDDLRAFLRGELPAYMAPSVFVFLDRLPLTPTGKVNLRALPAPGGDRAEGAFVAPRTPIEQALAGVWSKVLRVSPVGAEDNFFELGGHSLLAAQVISHLRQAFRVEVSLREFFEAPTVAGLSLAIAHRLATAAPAEDVTRLLDQLESRP